MRKKQRGVRNSDEIAGIPFGFAQGRLRLRIRIHEANPRAPLGMTATPRKFLGSKDLRGGLLAGADAIGDTDPAVAVAGKRESGQLLAQTFDAFEAVEVADAVLGHGGLPFINAGEERSGAEADDLLQFGANDGDDGVVGKLPNVFGAGSGEKATEKSAVRRGAVREFVVDERGGQQAFAFTARDEKSETGRERLADVAIVAETNGDGRAVADAGEFGGELGTAS